MITEETNLGPNMQDEKYTSTWKGPLIFTLYKEVKVKGTFHENDHKKRNNFG